jgi:hypothetical protein
MTSRAGTLESRLFRRHWDDGLLDLFAGVGAVSIGVCWAVDLVVVGAAVPAVLVPIWGPLRRALIEPRAGLVEFSDARTARNRRLGLGSAVLGLLMLLLFVGLYVLVRSRSVALLDLVVPGVPAFLLGLLATLAGWGLGLPRFLAYAGVWCAGGFGVALADARPELAMLAGGLVVLMSGAWRLHRFLRLPVENAEVS